jgi:flagellar biosynthesis GTPase FlhF
LSEEKKILVEQNKKLYEENKRLVEENKKLIEENKRLIEENKRSNNDLDFNENEIIIFDKNNFFDKSNDDLFADYGPGEFYEERVHENNVDDSIEIEKYFNGNSKIKIVVDGNGKISKYWIKFQKNIFTNEENPQNDYQANNFEDIFDFFKNFCRANKNIGLEDDIYKIELKNITKNDEIIIYDDELKTKKHLISSKSTFINPVLFLFYSFHLLFSLNNSQKVIAFKIPFFVNMFLEISFSSFRFQEILSPIYFFTKNKSNYQQTKTFEDSFISSKNNFLSKYNSQANIFLQTLIKNLPSEEGIDAFIEAIFKIKNFKNSILKRSIFNREESKVPYITHIYYYVQNNYISDKAYQNLYKLLKKFWNIEVIPNFNKILKYRNNLGGITKNFLKFSVVRVDKTPEEMKIIQKNDNKKTNNEKNDNKKTNNDENDKITNNNENENNQPRNDENDKITNNNENDNKKTNNDENDKITNNDENENNQPRNDENDKTTNSDENDKTTNSDENNKTNGNENDNNKTKKTNNDDKTNLLGEILDEMKKIIGIQYEFKNSILLAALFKFIKNPKLSKSLYLKFMIDAAKFSNEEKTTFGINLIDVDNETSFCQKAKDIIPILILNGGEKLAKEIILDLIRKKYKLKIGNKIYDLINLLSWDYKAYKEILDFIETCVWCGFHFNINFCSEKGKCTEKNECFNSFSNIGCYLHYLFDKKLVNGIHVSTILIDMLHAILRSSELVINVIVAYAIQVGWSKEEIEIWIKDRIGGSCFLALKKKNIDPSIFAAFKFSGGNENHRLYFLLIVDEFIEKFLEKNDLVKELIQYNSLNKVYWNNNISQRLSLWIGQYNQHKTSDGFEIKTIESSENFKKSVNKMIVKTLNEISSYDNKETFLYLMKTMSHHLLVILYFGKYGFEDNIQEEDEDLVDEIFEHLIKENENIADENENENMADENENENENANIVDEKENENMADEKENENIIDEKEEEPKKKEDNKNIKEKIKAKVEEIWKRFGCNNLTKEEQEDFLHLFLQNWLLIMKFVCTEFKGYYPHFLGGHLVSFLKMYGALIYFAVIGFEHLHSLSKKFYFYKTPRKNFYNKKNSNQNYKSFYSSDQAVLLNSILNKMSASYLEIEEKMEDGEVENILNKINQVFENFFKEKGDSSFNLSEELKKIGFEVIEEPLSDFSEKTRKNNTEKENWINDSLVKLFEKLLDNNLKEFDNLEQQLTDRYKIKKENITKIETIFNQKNTRTSINENISFGKKVILDLQPEMTLPFSKFCEINKLEKNMVDSVNGFIPKETFYILEESLQFFETIREEQFNEENFKNVFFPLKIADPKDSLAQSLSLLLFGTEDYQNKFSQKKKTSKIIQDEFSNYQLKTPIIVLKDGKVEKIIKNLYNKKVVDNVLENFQDNYLYISFKEIGEIKQYFPLFQIKKEQQPKRNHLIKIETPSQSSQKKKRKNKTKNNSNQSNKKSNNNK